MKQSNPKTYSKPLLSRYTPFLSSHARLALPRADNRLKRLKTPLRNKAKNSLDTRHALQFNELIPLNHGIGFSSPKQNGRHAAHSATSTQAAFSCLYNTKVRLSMAGSGGEAFGLAGSFCQSANPATCPPLFTFNSVKVVLQTKSKGYIMRTIRKAFTRPIFAQPMRTFSALEQANDYIGKLTANNGSLCRFNIQQTANGWVVGRVAA